MYPFLKVFCMDLGRRGFSQLCSVPHSHGGSIQPTDLRYAQDAQEPGESEVGSGSS